jgi:nucleotide-binding universal stress UspA family protein
MELWRTLIIRVSAGDPCSRGFVQILLTYPSELNKIPTEYLVRNLLAQKQGKGRKNMVPKIRKILFATDLSENSVYAFYFAIELAKQHNATIVILHAVEPVSPHARIFIGTERIAEVQKETVMEATEEIKNRLQNFCRKVEGEMGAPCVELVSKTLVPLGHPPEEILNAADKEDCDVIILGMHSKGFIAHTFLGDVSNAVLQRTRKPVLVIPLPSGKSKLDSK